MTKSRTIALLLTVVVTMALILSSVTIVAAEPSKGIDSGQWPQFQRDAANTGLAPSHSTKGVITWVKRIGGSVSFTSSVVIGANGIACVGTEQHGIISAIEAATGRQLWTHRSADGVFGLAIDDDKSELIVNGGRTIGIYDLQSGRTVATFAVPAILYCTPILVNDQVYYACPEGSLVALDLNNLHIKVNHLTVAAIEKPASDDESLYLGTANGLVHLNLETLDVVSKATDKNQVSTAPVMAQNIVIVGIYPPDAREMGQLIAYERATNTVIWRRSIDSNVQGGLATDGSKLFAAAGDGRILCLNLSTGTVLWTATLDDAVYVPLIVEGARSLVAISAKGTIYDYSLSGSLNWKIKTGKKVLAGVAMGSDGSIYFANESGELYSIH